MEEKNNDPFRVLEEKNDKESHLIDALEKKLYSRQDEMQHKERTILHPKKFSTGESWSGSLEYKKSEEKIGMSLFLKFFLFSFAFFLVAAGIAGYSLFSKRIVVSPNNVTISLFGPVSIKGGEELSLQVLVENKNTAPLNSIQFTADFPDGSRYINNSSEKLTHTIKKLDPIEAGEVRTETVKALILGKENDKKEISIAIRFSIEGSNAVYTKTKKFKVNLTTPPISFTANVLKEVTSGQDVTLGVEVKSSSITVLSHTLFKIDYPKGFIFKGSNPAPSFGDNIWSLGDMNFGETKNLEVRGTLLGESEQEKVFHLSSGTGSEKNQFAIGTLFGESQTSVTIKKPFLGIAIFVNGSSTASPIINEWKSSDISIQWTNSLRNKIIDGEMEVSLVGEVINKKSVTPAMEGFYDSFKNTIFWDKRAIPSFSSVAPGEKGNVEFSFSLIPFSTSHLFRNPEITMTTSIKGTRIDENNVPEEINFFATKKIKISTEMNLLSYGRYYGSPIPNKGPIPPKVGKETTYTITWEMTNTANNVSGAEVTASLPLSVQWTGKVYPTGAPVSYNSISHEVTWKLGNIKAAKGYIDEPEEVSFQVVLTPGLSQLTKSPSILSKAILTATDDFTGVSLSTASNDVSTIIIDTDPKIKQEDTAVVE